ncbi:sodium/proline symporter [Bacteroidota bacterium]
MNNTSNLYTLVSFIGYIILIILIGIYSARFSSRGLSEFFLGGRKMNKFVVALSAVASGRSSWLLIGLTGMAYIRGFSAIWAAVGYIITEFLMFLYAAPKLRKHTEDHNDLTIPDYFESRFGDKKHLLRIISASIIIVFMTAYISAQFVGGGKAFSTSFNISQFSGILITSVIVLLYTIIGGFLAVSLTDVIQGILMLVSLVILPIFAIIDFGGVEKIIDTINIVDNSMIDPFAISIGSFLGFIGIGLGSPGNPHILVRYMSIKNPNQLKFSAYVGTFWNIIMAISAVIIGVIGRAYFHTIDLLPNADSENLFPHLAQTHLDPVIFGIIIASILAAIMSTADSMLLVSASAIIRDIYQKTINPSKVFTERELVFYSRLIILFVVLLAFLFGHIASDLVFWLVLFAWGGLGAAFGPTILLSLFWKGTTKEGVIAGLISGVFTIIIWNQVSVLKSFLYELVPAFLISTLLTILISNFTRK